MWLSMDRLIDMRLILALIPFNPYLLPNLLQQTTPRLRTRIKHHLNPT